jgi:hypothetical protein
MDMVKTALVYGLIYGGLFIGLLLAVAVATGELDRAAKHISDAAHQENVN